MMITCVFAIRRFKDGQSIVDGDSYIIHKNGTLEISVAQPLNGGKYTCVASNNLGNKENHVHLEVKGRKSYNCVPCQKGRKE